MSTPHRRWLPMALALACTLGLPLAGAPVLAQDWPNKPVRVIVPFPPGGGTDTVARPLTAKLTQLTGQQFNIDNRGGAGGTIGAAMAAKALADGYSVLLAPVHLAVAVSAYKSLPYELEKDLVPATTVAVFLFEALGSAAQHIRSGKLQAIAVTSAKRSASFPDIPTAAESGLPGFEVTSWYGLWVPAGTPPAVVQRLHGLVVRAFEDPEVRELWFKLGAEAGGAAPQAFAAFVRAEVQKWGKVVRDAGVTIE